jgi:hypothetical protein
MSIATREAPTEPIALATRPNAPGLSGNQTRKM